MMMWIELIYIATSFVVRNPNIVLDGRWRPLVHLRAFAQRMRRRISPARYEGGETPDADSTRDIANGGVSKIRRVDSDNTASVSAPARYAPVRTIGRARLSTSGGQPTRFRSRQ
jgi:hypothetical protein